MTLYEIHCRVQAQIIAGYVEKMSVDSLRRIYKSEGWTILSMKEMKRIEFNIFGRELSESERILEINKIMTPKIIENFIKSFGL